MDLNTVEQWVRWAGGAAVLAPLIAVFWGMWRGLRRPHGRATGWGRSVLRAPYYLAVTLLYFGFCFLVWKPLPLALSEPARLAALALGALLYFPGLAFLLWARLALGEMYNVSSGFGVQLYADQRLVTRGPFAIVRHPMYLGLIVTALGGLLIFRTWTAAFLAVNSLFLVIRARREEQALAAEFGDEWAAYCRRVPAWRPRLRPTPSQTALLEVTLMFSPALPAYLWLWPSVRGTDWLMPVQVAVYIYFLAGGLFIGLRRWTLRQLGLNWQGLWLSLISGALVIAGRVLVTLSVDWPLWQNPVTLAGLIGDLLFYFGAVGLVEELLFRGLIYRALDEWRGTRLAIWGSSLAFGLYHVGWQGPLGAVAGLLIGAIFAAIRWRAGGFVGLIFVHGLMDEIGKLMLPAINPQDFGRPDIAHPLLLILGYILILIVPLYLWKFHPILAQPADRRSTP
jgi:protein-S-isoprenylcysteine O-methyltransferase Ste14